MAFAILGLNSLLRHARGANVAGIFKGKEKSKCEEERFERVLFLQRQVFDLMEDRRKCCGSGFFHDSSKALSQYATCSLPCSLNRCQ